MRRGEVWWYENPEEPPRPWVILTRDEAIEATSDKPTSFLACRQGLAALQRFRFDPL
jgi:mRNA-degrading endonuclease toxin of MazEF toxin-antitoxin module